MAHFTKAPVSLLTHTPRDLAPDVKQILARSGTYNIYDESTYKLKVPLGNSTWKGEQARLIGVFGGDEVGNRLDVSCDPPILDIKLVSEQKVGHHLWAWLVQPKQQGQTGTTMLYGKTSVDSKKGPAGRHYVNPLPVTVMDEVGNAGPTGNFSGGTREETITAIKEECRRQGVTLKNQIAYILATAQWEAVNFGPAKREAT